MFTSLAICIAVLRIFSRVTSQRIASSRDIGAETTGSIAAKPLALLLAKNNNMHRQLLKIPRFEMIEGISPKHSSMWYVIVPAMAQSTLSICHNEKQKRLFSVVKHDKMRKKTFF